MSGLGAGLGAKGHSGSCSLIWYMSSSVGALYTVADIFSSVGFEPCSSIHEHMSTAPCMMSAS